MLQDSARLGLGDSSRPVRLFRRSRSHHLHQCERASGRPSAVDVADGVLCAVRQIANDVAPRVLLLKLSISRARKSPAPGFCVALPAVRIDAIDGSDDPVVDSERILRLPLWVHYPPLARRSIEIGLRHPGSIGAV